MWSQGYYAECCVSILDKEMNEEYCQKLGLCMCSQNCINNIPAQITLQISINQEIMMLKHEDDKKLSDSQISKDDNHKFVMPFNFKKKIKKVDYFTKNFLPSFKMSHLYYLRKKLGASFVDSFPVVKRLSKNGITLKDYEELYKIQQFRIALAEMLDSKTLYRELMISRSKPGNKIIHNQVVFNFQKVLATRTFKRIAQHKSLSVPQIWVR